MILSEQAFKHMVIFCLMHEIGSAEAAQFLEDGRLILSSIPTVSNFSVFRQVSPKNDYDYGFSMDFADSAAYMLYNEHPQHTDFVKNRWLVEVSRFLEIDFQAVQE
jgi:hypothetical protein